MYLYPPNKQWPQDFRQECALIRSADIGALDLFHIGSTAVDGLYAKNCIDILGVVQDLNVIKKQRLQLIQLGYVDRGENGIPGRQYFTKTHRKVHLHVFQAGNPQIERHLSFVQIMRSTPELVTALNQLKIELHNKFPDDKDRYQTEKQFFYAKLKLG